MIGSKHEIEVTRDKAPEGRLSREYVRTSTSRTAIVIDVINNDQQNEMVFNVTDGGMTTLEAAQVWVDANEAIWSSWIP